METKHIARNMCAMGLHNVVRKEQWANRKQYMMDEHGGSFYDGI